MLYVRTFDVRAIPGREVPPDPLNECLVLVDWGIEWAMEIDLLLMQSMIDNHVRAKALRAKQRARLQGSNPLGGST